MPRTIEIEGVKRAVATEKELLDFANTIRQAGGAGVIEALIPSTPGRARSCLIANALNFGCQVAPSGATFKDGSPKWEMYLPDNLTDDHRAALGRVKGVRLGHDHNEYWLSLPKHIGNAAKAFDLDIAFREFATWTA